MRGSGSGRGERAVGLTIGDGPLAGRSAAQVNYTVDGPEHRLFFTEFPRRVRAIFAGEVVLDSRRAQMLHETGLLPRLYVPDEDVAGDLLTPSDHTTHCPFKGDAAYWSLRVGDRVAQNAVWAYPEPKPSAPWLRGYQACYATVMDGWFDEDEEVPGELRDPFHRVDARASSRHVRVTVGGQVVAETSSPVVLSETGLPNRFYVPREDTRTGMFEPSATHTVCPYKGLASYHTVTVAGRRFADVAWFYPQPLENALKVRDHVAFVPGDGVEVLVDGEPLS